MEIEVWVKIMNVDNKPIRDKLKTKIIKYHNSNNNFKKVYQCIINNIIKIT